MGHNTCKTMGAVLCVVRRLTPAVGGHFEFREYPKFSKWCHRHNPLPRSHTVHLNNKQQNLFHTNSRACVLAPRRIRRSPAIEI